MKIIYKNMKGRLLELINKVQVIESRGKHLNFGDVIPTVRISRSFIADTLSSEVEIDTVLDGIEYAILGNKNGVRAMINGKATQLVMRKNKEESLKAISNAVVLVNIDGTDSILALFDDIDNKMIESEVEVKLTKEDRYIDLVNVIYNGDRSKSEQVKEETKYPIQSNSMGISMIIGAHTGMVWKAIENTIPKSELVEVEDGEDSIDFIRYEMIKHHYIKSYMISYLCKMDNFLFSNLYDTEEHKKLIPKVWYIIHEEIPKYHKDKSDKKDFNFSFNVGERIKAYLKEDLGIELVPPETDKEKTLEKPKVEVKKESLLPKKESELITETKVVEQPKEDIKAEEKKEPEIVDEIKVTETPVEEVKEEDPYIPTDKEVEEFNKDLAEVDAIVKEIEEKAKENSVVMDIINNKGKKEIEKVMVRKIKSGNNKKEVVQNLANQNEALKASVKVAYTGVIKSILVHMQTWDLEDLVAVLLNARNQAVKLYENGKDKERNREIITALQRCAMWISEVWRNKQDNIHTIYCVEMEESEFMFFIERAGVPWVIDSKTLGMILQFESPNKEIDLVDMSKSDFVKKHMEFMRASGLLNPLMHDDLSIIPVDSIVKKDVK